MRIKALTLVIIIGMELLGLTSIVQAVPAHIIIPQTPIGTHGAIQPPGAVVVPQPTDPDNPNPQDTPDNRSIQPNNGANHVPTALPTPKHVQDDVDGDNSGDADQSRVG